MQTQNGASHSPLLTGGVTTTVHKRGQTRRRDISSKTTRQRKGGREKREMEGERVKGKRREKKNQEGGLKGEGGREKLKERGTGRVGGTRD